METVGLLRSVAVRTVAVEGIILLAAIVALWPPAAVPCAALLAIGAVVVAHWGPPFRVVATEARAPVAILAAAVLAGATLAIALWPVLAVPIAVLSAFLALAWRKPAWALPGAILLFGFEGSTKILLDFHDEPFGVSNRALGAALLDVMLFGTVAVVLSRDGLRTPRSLWERAARAERWVLLLLTGWLAVSVLQIVQGGDLTRGLHGFRLFQAYSLVAVAVLVACAARGKSRRIAAVVVLLGLVVGFYAAARVVIGPSEAERELVTSEATVVSYGGALRATGSFSGAVGLSSYLTPLTVFAVVAGYFLPRLRVAAWAMAVLGLVAIVGSYGRAPLVSIALGLIFALAVTLSAADVSRRRKLIAVGLVAGVLVATYAGAWVAGQANDQLRERSEGILQPWRDKSVELRFEGWGDKLDDVASAPLGHGVGTVGSASAPERGEIRTTDNSFLKVLYEQGIPVAVALLAALLGAVTLATVRLRNIGGEARAVGLAALSGLVAFMGLAMTGEYVEQPGKVVAWGLLGLALAVAFGQPAARSSSGTAGSDASERGGG